MELCLFVQMHRLCLAKAPKGRGAITVELASFGLASASLELAIFCLIMSVLLFPINLESALIVGNVTGYMHNHFMRLSEWVDLESVFCSFRTSAVLVCFWLYLLDECY